MACTFSALENCLSFTEKKRNSTTRAKAGAQVTQCLTKPADR
jgi:hypothetical protein